MTERLGDGLTSHWQWEPFKVGGDFGYQRIERYAWDKSTITVAESHTLEDTKLMFLSTSCATTLRSDYMQPKAQR